MKKLAILSLAALSTISAYASITIDMEVAARNQDSTEVLQALEQCTYVNEELGLKVDVTAQEDGDEAAVTVSVSKKQENGEFAVTDQAQGTLPWGETVRLNIKDGAAEESTEAPAGVMSVAFTATKNNDAATEVAAEEQVEAPVAPVVAEEIN